jgi:hypothetical protein
MPDYFLEQITRVLLLDGWHHVVPGTFHTFPGESLLGWLTFDSPAAAITESAVRYAVPKESIVAVQVKSQGDSP